jgi:hypothetical protein
MEEAGLGLNERLKVSQFQRLMMISRADGTSRGNKVLSVSRATVC